MLNFIPAILRVIAIDRRKLLTKEQVKTIFTKRFFIFILIFNYSKEFFVGRCRILPNFEGSELFVIIL
jgi:hypothetical protein